MGKFIEKIDPTKFDEDSREKLKNLCLICPDITINDSISDEHWNEKSSGQDYLDGEKIIDSVLSKVKEEWTDVQKIAYIIHFIGTYFTYSPTNDTEIWDDEDERSLWRCFRTHTGVCNTFSAIAQYMLNRLNVNIETICS